VGFCGGGGGLLGVGFVLIGAGRLCLFCGGLVSGDIFRGCLGSGGGGLVGPCRVMLLWSFWLGRGPRPPCARSIKNPPQASVLRATTLAKGWLRKPGFTSMEGVKRKNDAPSRQKNE